MSESPDLSKYDDILTSILVNEKSVLGFLSTIFNFLARRTDFYYVPKGPYENMGFPPGVAEELVLKVLKSCDPKNRKEAKGESDLNNEIMCSTVAQEVEVVAEENLSDDNHYSANTRETNKDDSQINEMLEKNTINDTDDLESYTPPIIPIQKNSDTYNGAERDKYLWSQTIMELDIVVKLPATIKSSKQLKVTINSGDICVHCLNEGDFIKDSLPFKIKPSESFWTFSEGKLLIHLEKAQERWWIKLLNSEEELDIDKMDCSRPLDELPEDHVAKVRELQWNQQRKLKGLPTSDEIRNIDILKKAWNAAGSPFQGQEFDPSVLSQPNISSLNL